LTNYGGCVEQQATQNKPLDCPSESNVFLEYLYKFMLYTTLIVFIVTIVARILTCFIGKKTYANFSVSCERAKEHYVEDKQQLCKQLEGNEA
jgi:hypothetical protein